MAGIDIIIEDVDPTTGKFQISHGINTHDPLYHELAEFINENAIETIEIDASIDADTAKKQFCVNCGLMGMLGRLTEPDASNPKKYIFSKKELNKTILEDMFKYNEVSWKVNEVLEKKSVSMYRLMELIIESNVDDQICEFESNILEAGITDRSFMHLCGLINTNVTVEEGDAPYTAEGFAIRAANTTISGEAYNNTSSATVREEFEKKINAAPTSSSLLEYHKSIDNLFDPFFFNKGEYEMLNSELQTIIGALSIGNSNYHSIIKLGNKATSFNWLDDEDEVIYKQIVSLNIRLSAEFGIETYVPVCFIHTTDDDNIYGLYQHQISDIPMDLDEDTDANYTGVINSLLFDIRATELYKPYMEVTAFSFGSGTDYMKRTYRTSGYCLSTNKQKIDSSGTEISINDVSLDRIERKCPEQAKLFKETYKSSALLPSPITSMVTPPLGPPPMTPPAPMVPPAPGIGGPPTPIVVPAPGIGGPPAPMVPPAPGIGGPPAPMVPPAPGIGGPPAPIVVPALPSAGAPIVLPTATTARCATVRSILGISTP